MSNNPKDNIEKLIEEKGVQFRDFQLADFETREMEDGNEEMIVRGVACVFNQPTVLFRDGEIEYKEQVDPHAFEGCSMGDVIFNYNHCGRVYARTRNNSLRLMVETDGLHMEASLWKDDEGHAQLYRDIKRGNVDRMSFAFTVDDEEYDAKQHLRTIKHINKLFDVSAVDIPAYDTTVISARSFFDAEREKELKEIEERKKALELAKAKYFYNEVK